MINAEYWFMLPVALIISSVAMLTGIGGAIMFSPFFILVLRINPIIAVGVGLFIEFFGFSSGVIGYLKQRSIRFDIVKKLIAFTFVGTLIGIIIGRFVSEITIQLLLSLVMFYLAYKFLSKEDLSLTKTKKAIVDTFTKVSTFLGSVLLGMVSSGLGELNDYNFLERMRLSVSESSATSVFLVASSAIIGSIAHVYFISTQSTFEILSQAFSIALFAVPGVIIGAQVGVQLSKKVSFRFMEEFIGILMSILGFILIYNIFT